MKRLIALFVLLLWSVSLADGASAATRVWCVGADGHAGVEYAIGNNCADVGPTKAQCTQPSLTQSHCGACVDVAMDSGQASLPIAMAFPAPAEKIILPVLVHPLVITEDQQSQSWTLTSADSPRLSPQLLEHRSVVLLI